MATAASTSQAPTQAQLIQQDAALAANLLQTASRYYSRGQSANGKLGQQISISMPTTGIMTHVDLHITCSVDITAEATANPVGAAGLIQLVTTSDWYGNTRTNTSASRLQSLNGYHTGRPYNKIATSLKQSPGGYLYDLPTAVGTANIDFWLHIPLAASPNSLVGALLTQTANGSCQINLTSINSLVSSTDPLAPYSAGTLTASNVYVTPYWSYLMPSNGFAPQTLPTISLSTAYSIQDIDTPQNLAVGVNNLTNFPAARIIHSQLLDFKNGSSMNFGTDLNSLSIIINGATPLKTWDPMIKLIQQRNALGADDIPGRYYFGYTQNPINTQVFGSYQIQVNPSVVNTGANLVVASEMTYAMGVPLPGLSV